MPVLLTPREAPRIGGSEGGFIGLVVGLIVIILGSCVAIYFLLRDHAPSDRDREIRREERRSSVSPSRKPWSEKLGGFFGCGPASANANVKRNSKSGHGWIQASGDAWEADEAERRGRGEEMVAVDAPFSPPMVDPYAPEHNSYSYESTDSVSYDMGGERYTPIIPAFHIPRSASPDSSAPSTVKEQQSRDRHFSVDSVKTFEGGTKFIEGL
ncbi:hypothetical protein B0H14DRAFT_3506954 [Mycena olivaceomarginata]|nr:hypothetical protein B0H14DRAFT_3506954 [Mycena olivaceomarginata]